MSRSALTLLFSAALLLAQPQVDPAEQAALRESIGEAGNSPVEFLRALEGHLKKFPQTTRRDELERAIAKTAIQVQDPKRIIEYGERVLKKDRNDGQILEEVAEALIGTGDVKAAARAITYLEILVDQVRIVMKEQPGGAREQARHRRDAYQALGRAQFLWARALDRIGEPNKAVELARESWANFPAPQSARFAGDVLMKLKKPREAADRYADAFAVAAEDRAADRAKITEAWKASGAPDTGMGDAVLAAFDRIAEAEKKRTAEYQAIDPNYGTENPMDFTLTGVNGERLSLKSLRGKVVVFDFWATWCGPCRQQYPLYEQVKQRFAATNKVVFLALNTDEDRAVVKPFLEKNQWSKQVYFDEGLSSLLKVSSIPTTMIFNGRGAMTSRLNGFLPERFVDMLSERIVEALNQ